MTSDSPAAAVELGQEEIRAQEKAEKKAARKAEKVGIGKLLLWNTRAVSLSINVIMMGYLQLYCTNTLYMAPALVSTMLVASKLLDAFTDTFIGYIIDRTQTKWGKARPYELCIVGMWFSTWLLFSVPEDFSTVAKCVWIFVTYALVNSVFENFLHTSNTAYMVRAFAPAQYNKLTSYSSVVVMLSAVIFNVMFPSYVAEVGNSAPAWSRLILMVSLLMSVLGIMRMIFIPEKYVVDEPVVDEKKDEAKVSFKDVVSVFKNNKYILIVALTTLVFNIVCNMGVSLYYWTYIVGDVGQMGITYAAQMVSLPLAFVFPVLLRKISVRQLAIIGFLVSACGYFINAIAGSNIALLSVAAVLWGAGSVPASMLTPLMVIDCIDYNEWTGKPRMDGVTSSIYTFSSQIGASLGTACLGYLLQFSGFDASLEVMPEAALNMISALFGVVPAVLYIFVALTLVFYKLDKLKPQMTAELAARRAEVAAAAEEAEA